MLNILARLIFQLIPTACPNHFATGDVYTLLSILKSAPVDADLILVNQDLAGFFTSIDQDRFIRSWFMLLDFLRPKMNVFDEEAFSVYPGKSNNPGDIIKGRTFRRLNVTRKIVIGDVPDLIKSALNMQTFALGQRCVRQSRGSPMGSPLSPALCLMVVSISEQIWHSTFHQLLSNHHLFIRHIRYVGNRLIFGDKRLTTFAPYEVLLDDGFYGKPIMLETEPDQEFLGFMLETKPLELIYQGPTNLSQVLSPFSASPPKVLLSGFRSRCHIVIKGAFPNFRVQQGLSQLIRLYTRAGFPNEELQTISNQLLIQHQNLTTAAQTCGCSLPYLRVSTPSCFRRLVPPCCVGLVYSCFCLCFSPWFFGFVCVSLFDSFLAQPPLRPLLHPLGFPHGSCSRPCVSPPPGSGNHASQPFGGALTFFRAIHWIWRLFASVTFPLGTSNIQGLTHFCSFTTICASTNNGVTWRNPVPHGDQSGNQPASYVGTSPTGQWTHAHHWGTPTSSSHVRSRSRSNSGYFDSCGTSSGRRSTHYPSPGSVQATGLIHDWPTTKEETKRWVNSGVSNHHRPKHWSPGPTSYPIRCTFWGPKFRWLRWWRFIGRCFDSWSSSCRCIRISEETYARCPQLPWRSCQHCLHHSTRNLHAHLDTKPKSSTVSNFSSPPTKSCGSTSWSTISSMDQRRRSRVDQHEAGHKVPPFVEDDWIKTSSWSPSM